MCYIKYMTFITSTQAAAVAQRVAVATGSAKAGVVVTLSNSREQYVIWAIGTNGLITQHALEVSQTTEERLTAHVSGFIANHVAAFAAAC